MCSGMGLHMCSGMGLHMCSGMGLDVSTTAVTGLKVIATIL